MKVHICDKKLIEVYLKFASAELTIFSAVVIFFNITDYKLIWAIGIIALLIITLLSLWWYANKVKSTTLSINGTKIIVREGDLFAEEDIKIIPCNDFFDTQVDDKIIATKSLHGVFIQSHVTDINELKKCIFDAAADKQYTAIDQKRKSESQIRFKLGTIIPFHDYFLLAYSKFDKNNQAHISNEDVALCYSNMWKEVDIARSGNSICMPLLGAGKIVRFEQNYTPQQLLELILWSFKISGVHLASQATLTIIIHKSTTKEINFWDIDKYSD